MINISGIAGPRWLAALALCCAAGPAPAAQVLGVWSYAFSEYGDIKYPENFAHYDFVNPNAPKGGTFRLSQPDRRTSFDKYNPYTLPESSPSAVQQFMFEFLADPSPDEPATMYGLLASQMLVAPDYSAISFRINPLAHFNNGDQVTADDVKYSFDMAVSQVADPGYAQLFNQVKEAIVVDSRTVRFNLKSPSRDQIYYLGTEMAIFSRKWGRGEDGKTKPFNQIVHEKPISTGPYLISRGTGQMLDLVRDPNYWARNLGIRKGFYNFDHLLYHYYSDLAARFEAFKAGDFEMMEETLPKRFVRRYVGSKFRDGEIIKTILPEQMGFYYEGYLLNNRRPQFSDWRVRSALNYAFDWSWSAAQGYDLIKRYQGLFENTSYQAAGLPSPEELKLLEPYRKQLLPQVFGVPESNPVSDTPAKLRANLLHARDLLAQAGWTIHADGLLRNAKGQSFEMEVLEDDLDFEPTLLRWADNLKKLGIMVRLRLVDFAVYEKRADAFDFDCTLFNYGYFQTLSPSYLHAIFSGALVNTPGSYNYMGIANPAIDHLIDVMARATTREQLQTSARALDRVFISEHYGIAYQYRPGRMVAYWNRLGIPAQAPKYYTVEDGIDAMAWPVSTWWDKSLH
jgi:ABC-type oligopeptide transport system substrate-binding subunit